MLFSSHMLVCARTLRIVARLFGKRLFATPNFVTSAAGRPTSLPADFDNQPTSRSFVSPVNFVFFEFQETRIIIPRRSSVTCSRYARLLVTNRFYSSLIYCNDRFLFFFFFFNNGNTKIYRIILGTGIVFLCSKKQRIENRRFRGYNIGCTEIVTNEIGTNDLRKRFFSTVDLTSRYFSR